MKKNKNAIPQNYLDRIPSRPEALRWTKDNDGIVTLEINNTGAMNRIAQVLFRKPKVSYIHLDKFGSFVWDLIDGERDITAIGGLVEAEFGEEAHPLYERLATYFRILESYRFVEWMDK